MPKFNIKRFKSIPPLYKIIGVVCIIVVVFFATRFFVQALNINDPFTDETKIGRGTVKVARIGGQIKLEECYTPDGAGWSLSWDNTLVRDITGAYNATVYKDIYCDDSNCILWSVPPVLPPGTVCIATDPNVYANILWEKTDTSTSKTWGPGSAILGGDIGGTHPTIGVGNNDVAVGTKKWLERYYTSAVGTYLAMDACKAKGLGWRLPTIVELDSIRDQGMGAAPFTRLNGIASDKYWSSSEVSATNAYYLYSYAGNVNYSTKSDANYVRCVRGQ
ncbi:MAG: DUF1566 domain-containing protein [Candidatus Nealsonbacteria bacterium]|nr:DUF1566 domain-containing protein [Candidatus Nealsonbacteria bacterium]